MKTMQKILSLVFLNCIIAGITFAADNGTWKNGVMGAQQENDSPIRVDSFRLPVIPPAVGIQFYKEGIVFLSSSKINRKMTPQHVAFGTLDTYYATLEDTVLGKPVLFSPDFPFAYPPEGFAISRDFQSMYFTAYSKKDQKLRIHKAMYTATIKKTGWLQDQYPLPFCRDNYNYAQPALSADGSLMVFSSDRQGTKGGMDLFVTTVSGDKWGDPVSPGEGINTSGEELFPFLDRENNLYFSSNGHPGKGGFDLYVCYYEVGSWSKPVNLTGTINTPRDELAIKISPTDGNTAFFTSRDPKSIENIQLYRVSLPWQLTADNPSALAAEFLKLTGMTAKKKEVVSPTAEVKVAKKETQPTAPRTTEAKETPKTEAAISVANEKKTTSSGETAKSTETAKTSTSSQPGTTASKTTPLPGSSKTQDTSKPKTLTPASNSPIVVYRVQFASSTKSKPSYTVKVGSASYKTWEYYYKGAYRVTIGEFPTLREAVELQNLCRKSGYPQAFVAAFKDGVRATDPALFK